MRLARYYRIPFHEFIERITEEQLEWEQALHLIDPLPDFWRLFAELRCDLRNWHRGSKSDHWWQPEELMPNPFQFDTEEIKEKREGFYAQRAAIAAQLKREGN